MVTHFSGDVQYRVEEDWEDVTLDMELYPGDIIRTGFLSFCQLNIEGLAEIYIQDNTIIGISSLEIENKTRRSDFSLDIGSAIFKVQHLVSDDEFQVRSKTAVCAIRGTEFGVYVEDSGDTTFFVNQGQIQTQPSNADISAITEDPSDILLGNVLDMLFKKHAVMVSPGNQIVYTQSQNLAFEAKLKQNLSDIKDLDESADKENIETEINQILEELFKQYQTQEIDAKYLNLFENPQESLKKTSEPLQEFQLEILTKPNEAKLYLNNQLIGTSPVDVKKTEGQYLLKIEKAGYKSYEKRISLEDNLALDIPLEIEDLQIITAQELIDLFDPPNIYYFNGEVVSADRIRDNYEMNYHNSFSFLIKDGRLKSINFIGDSGIDFYNGQLRFESAVEDVKAVLGEPEKIEVSEETSLYNYKDLKIEIRDNKVDSIMVLNFYPLLTHGSYSPHDWVIDFSLKLDKMIRDKGLSLDMDS